MGRSQIIRDNKSGQNAKTGVQKEGGRGQKEGGGVQKEGGKSRSLPNFASAHYTNKIK